MQFELDIAARLRSGAETFRLDARFSVSDRALVLFGPSGSGKTLTLKAVAGLLTPDAGVIRLDGEDLFNAERGVDVPTRRRQVGYVFQDYALFPHLTVRDNIGFGLRSLLRGLSAEDARRVDELMEAFGLQSLAGQRPASLSGGQRQRTALARALAPAPRLLLLDEPFSALDQPLRLRMRDELSDALARFDIPIVMVTHDPDEAQAFAETVVVYDQGAVASIHTACEASASGVSLSETLRREVERAYL